MKATMSSAEVGGFSPKLVWFQCGALMLPHTQTHTHTPRYRKACTYVIEVSGENRTGFPSETEIKNENGLGLGNRAGQGNPHVAGLMV